MPSISPIAEYLRGNHAIPKRVKDGCHFFSPEGLYLGRLTKGVVNNHKVITIETFGEGFKKMFARMVSIGQQFVYIKNNRAPLGVSLVPIKTYSTSMFVDFFKKTNKLEFSEKTLTNKLDLIAVDEETGVGLYDTDTPFKYEKVITKQENRKNKYQTFTHNPN